MRKGKIMFKVSNGQDPYSAIGKYIRDHITAIEDIIAVIKINEVETNQLFTVDINEENYFIWKNDWWEGEEDVTLIDFFPVSEAQHTNQSVQSADTISRQAAIDALDCINGVEEVLRSLPSVQSDHVADISKKAEGDCISRKEALKICRRYWNPTFNPIMEEIEKLSSVPPESKWTPCSKRLPEREGAYLVQALMNDDIFVARWEGCYWGVKTPIIAWMELPDPYRGGDLE